MVFTLGGCEPDRESSAATSQPTQLTITFQTNTTNGRYSPWNVHVVWVEKADGTFVKTLGLWATSRARLLTEWTAAAGNMENEIQARTGATERAYGTYRSQWDMTDADGNIVPDGDYMIRFELTSDNPNKNSYHRTSVPFTKSNAAGTIGPIVHGGYSSIVLDYQIAPQTD